MKKSWIAIALATFVLGGCSTQFLEQQSSSVRNQEKSAKEILLKNEVAIEHSKTQKSSAVTISDKVFLGAKPVPVDTGVRPPEFLSRKVEIVQDVSSIVELVEPLSSIARVPVVVRDDALLAASRGASLYSINAPTGGGASPAGGAPGGMPSMGASSGAGAAASAAASSPISFRFSGQMSSLFDLVAARFGISWRYNPAGTIEFYHRDTRTFTIMVLPGDLVASTDIGTSGGGGASTTAGSARTATQRTQATVGVTFWKSMEDSINAIKSRDGVVTVNGSAGTVTVTDTPAVLEQVAKLVESQNILLSRQVLLDVKVVTLKIKKSESLNLDWYLFYRRLSGNVVGLRNSFGSTDSSSPAFVVANQGNGSLSGSQAVMKALAEQAEIGEVTSAQQYALNNQPTPIQVGTTSRFIDTYTRSTDTTGQTTVTVTTGTVTSGVALQLLPRILDKENLLIHLSADLSETPENLAPQNYGSTTGQAGVAVSLWSQNVRNFMHRVSLKSGETLVLSGYENNSNKATKKGSDTPDNLALGGNRDAVADRTVIVILITPVIMDRIRS